MEKCPSCGNYTLSIDETQEELKCVSCGYSERVDIKKYNETHNDLPLLAAQPLSTREAKEIEKIIIDLHLEGTFESARKLDPRLKDLVRREVEYRLSKVKRKAYELERILKLLE